MSSVLRYVAGTKKSPKGTLYLQCHIKPGASKVREGVRAVTDDNIEICVSAQPRDGESNKAVLGVLSKVLDVPKTSLQITRGAKSRDKTIAVEGMSQTEDKPQELLDRVRSLLTKAIDDGD